MKTFLRRMFKPQPARSPFPTAAECADNARAAMKAGNFTEAAAWWGIGADRAGRETTRVFFLQQQQRATARAGAMIGGA